MKVLWVTNVPLADTATLLGDPPSPFAGWLDGSLAALSTRNVSLTVAAPWAGAVRTLGTVDGVRHVVFPPVARRDVERQGLRDADEVLEATRPDLVHVHGTELPHSAAFALAARARGIPRVVSVQGLVSVIAQHMTASLPTRVVHGVGSRPWVRSDRVAGMRRAFRAQGAVEIRTLRAVDHVIGRTDWDRQWAADLNPHARYHHCDETLRPAFYGPRWRIEDATPGAVFLSQGHYPVKGLHLLLAALPHVMQRHPGVVLTVAGQSPAGARSRSPYARHLLRLVADLGLTDHVRFVGPQDAGQMVRHYLSCSVVACTSVVENSPNSVAEGMLLGAPVVTADVGGVGSMVTAGVDALVYPPDAPEQLVETLVEALDDPRAGAARGARARQRAQVRHDPDRNAARTVAIYSDIVDQETR